MDHTVPLDKHQGSDSKSAEKNKYQWEKTEGLNPQLITQLLFFLVALVVFILEMSAFWFLV